MSHSMVWLVALSSCALMARGLASAACYLAEREAYGRLAARTLLASGVFYLALGGFALAWAVSQ